MATKISLEDRLELLRSKLETAVATPCAVAISSAKAGDGKSATSLGLAKSFAAANYRTVVLDANGHMGETFGVRRVGSLEQLAEFGCVSYASLVEGGFDIISVSSDSLRQSASRPSIKAVVDLCRNDYDVTIIDTAPLLGSSLALFFAEASDALLITVREGRSVKSEDQELMKTLERENITILGLVTVSRSAIIATHSKVGREPRSVGVRPVQAPEPQVPRAHRAVG